MPVICTNYMLTQLVNSLENVLANECLENLVVEGIPLPVKYLSTLVNGIFQNDALQTLDLENSKIGDEGCGLLCSNMKMSVKSLNLSDCKIGIKGGALELSKMLQIQEDRRNHWFWPEKKGIKTMKLNNNPDLGDGGMKLIIEALQEIEWVRDVETRNCGLFNATGELIVQRLAGKSLIIDVRKNNGMSEPIKNHVIETWGVDCPILKRRAEGKSCGTTEKKRPKTLQERKKDSRDRQTEKQNEAEKRRKREEMARIRNEVETLKKALQPSD